MQVRSLILAVVLSAPAAFSVDAALLNLVMPEARLVAGIDVERARESFLGKKMLESMDAKDSDFAKFVAMTGFDPRRDLREVVIAAADANAKNAPALIAVRGVFDTGRINGFLKVSGVATSEMVAGVEYFTKKDSKDDMGFAFLDGTTAIAGPRETVKATLQRRSGSGAGLNGATRAKVQDMSKANDMWFVTSIPVAELQKALPGGNDGGKKQGPAGMMGGDAFKGIEQAAMGVRFGSESMDLTAETVSQTEKDATGLADVVRFLSTMVQMNRENPDVKGLATALDTMKISTDAKTTRVTLSLPMAEIEKMMKAGGKPAAKRI